MLRDKILFINIYLFLSIFITLLKNAVVQSSSRPQKYLRDIHLQKAFPLLPNKCRVELPRRRILSCVLPNN